MTLRLSLTLPRVDFTRNEFDFANHLAKVIETNPEQEWVFIVDQLNTHKSVSLVRLVAACCELERDLGVKGKSGILKSLDSSFAQFLEYG